MIQEKIKNLIEKSLKNLEIETENIALEHPSDLKMGDYSTNIALALAKKSKTNPKELAEKIVSEISRLNLEIGVQKIEVAGAGFINFYLSPQFFAESLKEIIEEGDKFGKNNSLEGKRIMVEHTDANPFKKFHIGHLKSNTTGEAISRILEWNGAEVKRACYQGDVGMHIAKAVWALQSGTSFEEAYAVGAKAFDEDEKAKKEIKEINKKIYEKSDEKINEIYNSGRRESLESFDSVYKRLDSHFDYHFFESEVEQTGKEVVKKNIGKIFERGDMGAIIFKGENFDKHLHTRVFVNSEDQSTYEAKELGLNKKKFEVEPDLAQSIIVTGNEIRDYFKVLLKVLFLVFPDIASKTRHIPHGILKLPTGKMSSRTGSIISAENLIDEVKEKTKGNEIVAIAAIKYMILRKAIGGDIIFDIEKSVSIEGDSGPYLQYSYARARSVLEKAVAENIYPDIKRPNDLEIIEIEKILYKFPEIVLRAAEEFEPHYIANYLIELARAFNGFYGNNKIVDKNDPSSPYKIALTEAFSLVMKNGLYLLGIKAPERM